MKNTAKDLNPGLIDEVVKNHDLDVETLEITDGNIVGYNVFTFDDGNVVVTVSLYAYAYELANKYIQELLWCFSSDFLSDYTSPGVTSEAIKIISNECETANPILISMIEGGKGLDAFVDGAISADGLGFFLDADDGVCWEYFFNNEIFVSWIG